MTAALSLTLDYPHADAPPPGEAREIAPGVLWLRMPLPFALDHINLWALADGEAWTLVDSGFGIAATRDIWERHFETTLAARPVARVVVTHCHPDHVGNAHWLSDRFECPVLMTQGEFLTAHALAGEHSGYGTTASAALFRRHGMSPEHVAILLERGNTYRRGVPSLPATFQRIIDGQSVTIGASDWQVIEGHGHSPEHGALYSPDRRILISGDMLLPRITTNVSVWSVDPEGDPIQRFLDSLARFEALAPETLVLPSHGLPFRGIALRVAELRAHHAARLDEVLQVVRERGPVSAADIVPVLFRRELDAHQRLFAMGEAIAHLNHLWHAGRLGRLVSGDNCVLYAPSR